MMLWLFIQPVLANVEDINVTQTLATQGDKISQSSLGLMYVNGQGVEQNEQKAFEWFSKAATQGDVGSQYSLGIMYDNGYGTAKNTVLAKEWYLKAANNGNDQAKQALSEIQ